MSKDQRIELLKLARAAKAKKAAEKKNEKDVEEDIEATIETPVEAPVETPIKKPVKKPRAPRKTLNLELNDEPEIKDDEPEIVELTETVKVKKPKRRIVRKIIREEFNSDDTEEEIEEVIYKAPKKPIKQKKSETTQPFKEQNEIDDVPTKTSNIFTSFFNY